MTEKRCGRCREVKPAKDFNRRADGRLAGYCRSCFADYGREHREANPEAYRAASVARRARTQRLMMDYLADKACADCGETDPVVLQFDHVTGEKVLNVSWAVHNGWAWERILSEIDKCEIVCANDHARRTAERAGWFSWVLYRHRVVI